MPSDPDWAGEVVYTDERTKDCDADAGTLWSVVESIGGENGWYSFPLAWSVRGWLDRVVGGVGLTRGRRNPKQLNTGDPLGLLAGRTHRPGVPATAARRDAGTGRGVARMASPRVDSDRSRLDQRAIFFPKGLAGRLYWYSILPFHGIIFKGMMENITGSAARHTVQSG